MKKIRDTVVVIFLALVLIGSGFWLGFDSGRQYPTNVTISGVSNVAPAGSMAPADFSTFWEAWQDVNELYLRNPSTTPEQKVQGAINGMVNSLGDPYTEYFAPADNTQFQQDITGNFGGIGAELDLNTQNQLVIAGVINGTPADTAGLKAGDLILDINGTSTLGLAVSDAVNLIRGEVGSAVTLTVLRANWSKPQDFKITRANINVPTVEFAMKGNVAVITLNEFTQDADFLFYQALVKAVANNAQGIVLDLRDDPGGYLQVAVDIAGYFVKPGTPVVKEVGRTVPEVDYTAAGDGSLDTMPMVVLMNGNSASAAEILAGALHDDRNIPLVGTQSFGKGTVQQLVNLPDGSSLKITVAHWVLPSGVIIDHTGLTPTYNVTSTLADAVAGKDPQMDKALEVIQGEITAAK